MKQILNDKYFEKRGSLYVIYDIRDYNINFVQDRISKSYQGVIRGFHGDNKTWKLITCLYGKIKFVTYDLDSETKSEYILDGNSEQSISILIGPNTLNAHQCLSSECIFYYKWSEFYTKPEDQWSVYYNDLDINPCWDLSLPVIVSERDKNAQSLKELIKCIKIS